jgi:predicted PurR-regulated permease PerM
MVPQMERQPVPVRTILATIGLVLLTLVGMLLVQRLSHVLGLLVIAGFFTIILTPPVDWLVRRGMRRGMATAIVFLIGLALLVGLGFAFIQPVAREVNEFADNFPEFVEDAREGRGPIGRLVQRYNVDEYIEENQDRFREGFRNAGAPALEVAQSIFSTLFALVTILVLAFLMLLQGPGIGRTALNLIDDERTRERIRLVAADCGKAVTGYMAGNLAISVIAGVSTFIALLVIGVPFSGVLALWVAFADLIPLVGATLGAIPAVLVAFLASPGKGIAVLVFYIAYQQFENHVLQPTVMSRTVNINPLAVLVSVLIGVELFGILGALLAIPVAGIIQVIVRNVYDERRGKLKEVPTVGTDETPVNLTVPDSTS